MFYSCVSILSTKEEVFLVFDKYCNYSIKAQTRKQMAEDLVQRYQFFLNTPLPPKDSTLLSSKITVLLVDFIWSYLIQNLSTRSIFNKAFVVIYLDSVPTQVVDLSVSKNGFKKYWRRGWYQHYKVYLKALQWYTQLLLERQFKIP